LRFAYKQQLRCDPIGIPDYLQALKDIAEVPGISDSESLSLFVHTEKSKGYWLASERDKALTLLGFGENGPLRIEFDENDVDGQFLMNAYVTSWNSINANFGAGRPDERDVALRDLKDAVLITAQSTGREDLVGFVQEELRKRGRDPAQAHVTLGANHEIDDHLILAIFGMRASPTYAPVPGMI
jgi:ubiquitin carboxyl-terminal hydrolase 25/28